MKKLVLLLFVALLALSGCGDDDGGDSNDTGVLALHVEEANGQDAVVSALAVSPPEPKFARIVIRNSGSSYRRIEDVVLGSSPAIPLPTGHGYSVDVITYGNYGALKRMARYGAADNVSIFKGETTFINISGQNIAPLITSLPSDASSPEPGLFAGTSYTAAVTAEIPPPLHPKWYLALQCSEFMSFPHLPKTAEPCLYDGSDSFLVPASSSRGTLYAQGEFFIDPIFVDEDENATSWVIHSPVTTSPLLLHGGYIGGNIFDDIYPPKLHSFSVPAVVQTPHGVEVALSASDNVGVAGYLVTTSPTPPLPTEAGWQTEKRFSFLFDPPLHRGESVLLWAWAKDPSGNISAALPAGRSVTFDNLPRIQSIALPKDVQLTRTIPLAITANSFTAGGITSYFVSEELDPNLATATWIPWGTPANAANSETVQKLSYYYSGPVVNALNTVTLHAWVKDANGISPRATASFSTSNRPRVTAFAIAAPAAGARVFPIAAFTGTAFEGAHVTGYLITESPIQPKADDTRWTISPPLAYSYLGTINPGDSTRQVYAWVKDDQEIVSLQRTTNVRFTGIP